VPGRVAFVDPDGVDLYIDSTGHVMHAEVMKL
jgi:hypothetical protein